VAFIVRCEVNLLKSNSSVSSDGCYLQLTNVISAILIAF